MTERDRVLRLKTVLDRTGLSRATIYRMIKVGKFPAQVRPTEFSAGWLESDIAAWIKDLAAKRESKQVTVSNTGDGR